MDIACLFFFTLCFLSAAAQQTEIKFLSGKGSDNTVPWEFYCTAGMNSGRWTTIPVPSCWELQGFGKYDYGFAKDSIRGKERGLYKFKFNVPSTWEGKTVNIVFEGSMTDTEVRINGKSAGPIHQGAFYSFKYDVSGLLNYDQSNLLEVDVSKHSSNQSVNAAERRGDFWIFGGIFRPVFLEALPSVHIEQLRIDAKADGNFKAAVNTSGRSQKISIQVFTLSGKSLGPAITGVSSSSDGSFLLTRKFTSIRSWNAEEPVLYKAVCTIYSNGRPVHTVSQKFGFRTVEVRAHDGIYINGVKVKMKGVNRHSFWPTTGRTTSMALSIEDVLLMKAMNMNSVRMSHYPPDGHFLDVCDSLGLFVIDELAGWHGYYDTPTGSALLKEMVDHDAHHPSVIIWANGNEGGHNFELDAVFAKYDIQERPVIHPWQLFGGIETQHYREFNYGIGNYNAGREIVMPTEFLHGQFDGGHGAGLEDYWEKMWSDPLSAGGFLWDFADEGVVRKDLGDSIDTDKFRGADGIIGPFHEKEGSYYAIKEIWSPVYFERKIITPAFDGVLDIENRYHFTNTSRCRFEWELSKPGKEGIKANAPAPSLKPGEKGKLKLNLPDSWKQFDVLYITVYDPAGKGLFKWSFPIRKPGQFSRLLHPSFVKGKVSLQSLDSVFLISVDHMIRNGSAVNDLTEARNNLNLRIDRRSGLLKEVQNRIGIIPISEGPVLQEAVNNFENFTARYEADTLIISSAFDRKKSYNTLQWTIYPSGLVKMDVRYFPSEYFTWFDGVNFNLPESEIKYLTYTGNGPYRVWKNRMKGTQFGSWVKEYNNTETGESWKYPEFKGYYSNIYQCHFVTSSLPFAVYTENEDLFLRLYTPAWKTDQWHNYEPLFPSGDISFMQGIPAIGSKTQRAETTGPMGMKNIFYDYEKEPSRSLQITLYFDFLENTEAIVR